MSNPSSSGATLPDMHPAGYFLNTVPEKTSEFQVKDAWLDHVPSEKTTEWMDLPGSLLRRNSRETDLPSRSGGATLPSGPQASLLTCTGSTFMATMRLTRRRLLQAAGSLSFSAAGPLALADERKASARETPPRDAAEALTLLEAGNRRFSDGKLRHAHEAEDWRN
jgi:hypothetical protein